MKNMDHIEYIYEMNKIEGNERLDKDMLAGRGMDILRCIMNKCETSSDIAKRLGIPIYSVQLYINRMIKAHLIKEEASEKCDEQVEKKYSLIYEPFEIRNCIEKNRALDEGGNYLLELSAYHFSSMVRNAIISNNVNDVRTDKIRAHFIKAQKEDMEQLKKEIDAIFEKYQAMEDLSADKTYSLFVVLTPYEIKGDEIEKRERRQLTNVLNEQNMLKSNKKGGLSYEVVII